MSLNHIRCIRCIDTGNPMIKNGKTKSGKQRYLCKNCYTTRVENYIYKAYQPNIDSQIIILTKEGLGIRSTARVLKISTTTLLRRIISISKNIRPPMIPIGKEYEIDEIRTYIGNKKKLIWIVCALEKQSRKIVSFNVGRRTNQTLKRVIEGLHLSQAKTIYTDKLKNYSFLIEKKIHKTNRYGTNHIERKHLDLRTHLKRLNRRTICFSKSITILTAILKIYFWA